MMHLEVRDGVRGGQPRRARVLLGAEGPVESLCDCAEVVRANCRGSNAVPASRERVKFSTMKTYNMLKTYAYVYTKTTNIKDIHNQLTVL